MENQSDPTTTRQPSDAERDAAKMLLRSVALGIATLIEETPPKVWRTVSQLCAEYQEERATTPTGNQIDAAKRQTAFVGKVADLADLPFEYWRDDAE